MKINVGLISLGCPKNLVDSEVILSSLSDHGFSIVNNPKSADIIIINTCSFIKDARDESANTINEMAKYKKNGRCRGIIVTGCFSERYKAKLFDLFPFVDGIVGTGEIESMPSTIDNILTGQRLINLGRIGYLEDELNRKIISTQKHTAYIKIAEGCDNRCSYCIIPDLRGNFRSRKIPAIIKEAENLALCGVKEIILVAQDTTRYGLDIYNKRALATLLGELNRIESIKWIRFLYAYPDEIDDELIECVRDRVKIVKYFEIPIQHSEDGVLQRMRRRGNKELLYNLFSSIRKKIPDVALRTSVIVGFPCETNDDFENLKSFITKIKFDRLGVFKYSDEEGTISNNFDGKISEEIKDARFREIMELQQSISSKINQEMVGKTLDALVEKRVKNGLYIGRTERDAPEIDGVLYIKSKKEIKIGEFVKVKITKSYEYDLEGHHSA